MSRLSSELVFIVIVIVIVIVIASISLGFIYQSDRDARADAAELCTADLAMLHTGQDSVHYVMRHQCQ